MAEYTINKFTYGGNTYKLKDDVSGYKTTDTDTNTWRNIKVNGTEVLSTSISSGAVNFKQGTGINIVNSSGTLEVSSTVVNTDSKLALSEAASNSVLYPIIGSGTAAAERCFDTTGFSYVTSPSTTSVGASILTLGNSTASGTANNKQGIIQLYTSGAKYVQIASESSFTPTGVRNRYLPSYDADMFLVGTNTTDAVGSTSQPVYVDATGKISTCNSIPTTYVSTISTTAGTHSAISNKSGAVSFNVPTKTSHLTNDSGFITNAGVTGVKGSAESSYRTGQVNLTAANLGAAAASHTHTINEIYQMQSATAGGLDPLTQAMIGSGASNKSFHLPAAAIEIEYSTNGGSTWIDYGATDTQKIALFSETRTFWALLGKNSATGSSNTVNNWLRITIEPTDRYVFFNGLYIWMSTQGNTVTVDLERSTIGAKDTFTSVFTGQSISGWSGNNIRYFNGGSFGGGSTQTSNNYKYRLTFKQTAVNTNYGSAQINDIRFLGVNVWSSPNSMVSKNHLYTWDESLNATFPAQVTATRFNGGVKDAGSDNTITFQYSGSGITSTSWLAAWNGYKIMAITPQNAINFQSNNSSGKDANSIGINAITYYTSNGPSTSLGATVNDGALYVQRYNDNWEAQIAQDYRNGALFVRGKNNGTWQSWQKVYDSAHKPSVTDIGAATADHTHTTSIATSTGTNQITLAHGTKYAITAGGTSYVFTMPSVGTIPSITLNGTSTTSPSFYAPTSAGTSGYYLKSSGSGAPTWAAFPSIPSGNILYGTSAPGSSTGANGDIYCVYTS